MSALSRPFIAALNHLLERASWARERLAPHAGRTACLRAEPIDVLFGISPEGRLIEAAEDAVPEVTLSLPLAQAPALLAGDISKAMGSARIEGSAELADALGFVFRHLKWDVEEDLSRVVGDIPARRLVLAARAVNDAGLRAWQSLTENLSEYLGEEQAVLVSRNALAGFAHEVRRLRDDVARLEKRTGRLASRRPAPSPKPRA